jgi:LysM repeat protein
VTPPPAVTPAAPAVESAPVKMDPAAAPAAADSSTQTYTVKEGEDLYAVAIRWGVSPSDLKALNNLTSTELKAGTVLKIPGAAQ